MAQIFRFASPDLHFWSDTSDQGGGGGCCSLGRDHFRPLVSRGEISVINLREIRVVSLGLRFFREQVQGRKVTLFCDNTTAVAYLTNQGDTFQDSLNKEAQVILRWAEENRISLIPRFILGKEYVIADSLSRGSQVILSGWTLHPEVFNELHRKCQ